MKAVACSCDLYFSEVKLLTICSVNNLLNLSRSCGIRSSSVQLKTDFVNCTLTPRILRSHWLKMPSVQLQHSAG